MSCLFVNLNLPAVCWLLFVCSVSCRDGMEFELHCVAYCFAYSYEFCAQRRFSNRLNQLKIDCQLVGPTEDE